MNLLTKTLAAALIAGGASSLAGSADAVPLGASLALRDASTPAAQTVRWRGRGWVGLGVGLAVGAAIASSYRYNYGYRYYPAYSYGYYPGYSYGYAPAYSYGYYPAYSYGYASPYYGYAYRPRVYIRRAWRRW